LLISYYNSLKVMNTSKKFILIEFIFCLIPLFFAWVNANNSSLTRFAWGYDNIFLISLVAVSIALISNAYIYLQSRRLSARNWSVVSVLIIIFLVILIYIGNSISNFGF
jgi:hypothetical protein